MASHIDQVIAHKVNEIKSLPYARSIVAEDVIERNFGYRIVRHQVAQGKHSTIYKCESIKHAGAFCVVKPYKLGRDKIRQSLREETCQIMRFVSGKCAQLVTTYDLFYTNDKIYLMCDWSNKGEVLTAMQSNIVKVNEELLREWAIDIMTALQFLHNNAICHRNIAPSCLLLTSENRVKIGSLSDASIYCKHDGSLIKFKWANFSRRNNWNQAPEVATRKPYDGRRADVWSLGATIFWFAVRVYPINYFKGNKPKQLEDRLALLHRVTNRCRKFCSKLLDLDPNQRPTIAQAMELEWITTLPSGHRSQRAKSPEHMSMVEIPNDKVDTGEAPGPGEAGPVSPDGQVEDNSTSTSKKDNNGGGGGGGGGGVGENGQHTE